VTATTSVASYVKPRLTTACGWPPSSQQTRKSAPSRLVFRSRLRLACLIEFARQPTYDAPVISATSAPGRTTTPINARWSDCCVTCVSRQPTQRPGNPQFRRSDKSGHRVQAVRPWRQARRRWIGCRSSFISDLPRKLRAPAPRVESSSVITPNCPPGAGTSGGAFRSRLS
jgi:hypothetical protein